MPSSNLTVTASGITGVGCHKRARRLRCERPDPNRPFFGLVTPKTGRLQRYLPVSIQTREKAQMWKLRVLVVGTACAVTALASTTAAAKIGFSTPTIVDPISTFGEPSIGIDPVGDGVFASGPTGTGVQRSQWEASSDGGQTFRIMNPAIPPTAIQSTEDPPGRRGHRPQLRPQREAVLRRSIRAGVSSHGDFDQHRRGSPDEPGWLQHLRRRRPAVVGGIRPASWYSPQVCVRRTDSTRISGVQQPDLGRAVEQVERRAELHERDQRRDAGDRRQLRAVRRRRLPPAGPADRKGVPGGRAAEPRWHVRSVAEYRDSGRAGQPDIPRRADRLLRRGRQHRESDPHRQQPARLTGHVVHGPLFRPGAQPVRDMGHQR